MKERQTERKQELTETHADGDKTKKNEIGNTNRNLYNRTTGKQEISKTTTTSKTTGKEKEIRQHADKRKRKNAGEIRQKETSLQIVSKKRKKTKQRTAQGEQICQGS